MNLSFTLFTRNYSDGDLFLLKQAALQLWLIFNMVEMPYGILSKKITLRGLMVLYIHFSMLARELDSES